MNAEHDDRLRNPSRTLHHVVLDADHFDMTMGRVLQSLEETRNAQPAAIATAIGAVMTNKELVSKMLDTMAEVSSERAANAAGKGILRIVKWMLSRWLVTAAIVLLVARAAGVDAAKQVLQLLKLTN